MFPWKRKIIRKCEQSTVACRLILLVIFKREEKTRLAYFPSNIFIIYVILPHKTICVLFLVKDFVLLSIEGKKIDLAILCGSNAVSEAYRSSKDRFFDSSRYFCFVNEKKQKTKISLPILYDRMSGRLNQAIGKRYSHCVC